MYNNNLLYLLSVRDTTVHELNNNNMNTLNNGFPWIALWYNEQSTLKVLVVWAYKSTVLTISLFIKSTTATSMGYYYEPLFGQH